MTEAWATLIVKQRSAIISKWFIAALQAYPADTAAFLKSRKDRFANPVGRNTRKGLEGLFDQLVGDLDAEAVAQSLDPVMRIRAVQSLTPSQATAFIFSLKGILRDLFANEMNDAGMLRQFAEIENRIDRVGLAAFDVFMACREKLYELKSNETRNRVFKAFERAGLVTKEPEPGPSA